MSIVRAQEALVLRALHEAIESAPPTLFPEFASLRPLLLSRSPVSRNRPLFYAIADRLIAYRRTGTLPAPVPYSPMKSDVTNELMDTFFSKYRTLLNSIDFTSPEHLRHFFAAVGVSGLHILCGFRTTAGSDSTLFPPPTETLMAAFNERHKGQPLTVGGRAFSKHSVRDSSRFWGICTGKNEGINDEALKCLSRIIEYSVWNNVFALPHDITAYEVRVIQGYGARWEIHDGRVTFRGFVEPPMPDGHLKKWRH